MKNSISATHKAHRSSPVLQFERSKLTSFSGLLLFSDFFRSIQLNKKILECFRHLNTGSIYGARRIFLGLIIHVMLGYKAIRETRFYRDDPMILRVLGISCFPTVSTICRTLNACDQKSVHALRSLNRRMVINNLAQNGVSRFTLDFDGSVISTKRHAENSAVGFNKRHKGRRSYYPLFCMAAQSGQVLDVYHRPGNVHDSNGAQDFMCEQFNSVYSENPFAKIETRTDGAFFSQNMAEYLYQSGIEFTTSVPFLRLPELKQIVENTSEEQWNRANGETDYCDINWSPKSWEYQHRFVLVRKQMKIQNKDPIQLDLFVPLDFTYEYKVIITNKNGSASSIIKFHEGRGAQENVLSELKTDASVGYIPFKRWIPNQLYLLASVYAHNLNRSYQLACGLPKRFTVAKRTQLWKFRRLETIRGSILRRAGRFTRPQNVQTLTISGGRMIKKIFTTASNLFRKAA